MGAMTLTDFRTRLQAVLGNLGYTNAELDQWINAGLLELAGAVEFESLKDSTTIAVSADDYTYAIPAGTLAITSIGFQDGNGTYRWMSKTSAERMLRFSRETSGTPTRWARVGGEIWIHPTPDRAFTATVVRMKEPTLLAAAGNTTQFPATFDNAVFFFAAAHGFYDTGDDTRGAFWYDRAVRYAGSRLSDLEWGSEAISEPVRVIERGDWDEEARRG